MNVNHRLYMIPTVITAQA